MLLKKFPCSYPNISWWNWTCITRHITMIPACMDTSAVQCFPRAPFWVRYLHTNWFISRPVFFALPTLATSFTVHGCCTPPYCFSKILTIQLYPALLPSRCPGVSRRVKCFFFFLFFPSMWWLSLVYTTSFLVTHRSALVFAICAPRVTKSWGEPDLEK